MPTQSPFNHRPLESTLKKRRQHRSWSQLQGKFDFSKLFHACLFLILFLSSIFFLAGSPWFRVQHVSCSTQFSSSCEEAVLGELEQGKGRHLYFGSWEDEIKNIQRANPSYFTFTIKRKFPSRIEFKVMISPPRYVLKHNTDQKIITEAGSVIYTEISDPVPEILVSTDVWQKIDGGTVLPANEHQQLLSIATCLKDTISPIKNVRLISETEVRATTDNQKEIIFTQNECSSQLSQLDTILSYPLEQPWTEADLRFSKPILR